MVKLLFLSAVLLSSALLTLCDPLYVLSAPNLLRVGSSENVFVEAQDYSKNAFEVKITVKNHPKKDKQILTKSVNLNAQNNFQILTDIKIPDDQNLFSDDPLEKQYVYLQAIFPDHTLEKVVLLSFQSGYIFVQTDKPIYTPSSTVQYRTLSLTPNLKPLSQTGITVEIMNPQNITVSSDKVYPVKGMKSGKYAIPEVASLGIWKVVTRFANTPQKTFTAEFEVKEYVLPTFEVKLQPSKLFYYVGDESLTVDIEAKYLFGKQVEGNAFVMFGVMDGETKTGITGSLQKIQILKGVGTAELTKQMIETYKSIDKLVGQSIYVSVSLLTESGSEMVEAERRGIRIVTSPYTINFKKTAQFFKPGMPFDVSIYVTNPDETPAQNVIVEVNPGGVRGQTKANGIAKVTVNTQGNVLTQEITAQTKDPDITDEEQAVKKMTAHAYVPKGGSKNYLHIGIDAAELEIGDQMKVNLNTGQSPGVKDQDYTFMILSKGQIVKIDRFKRQGQALITLSQPVTKEMVPSFRFVAYYHVGANEVVSDSVWVDVKDTCMGKLKLQVKNKQNNYNTGEEVKLQISGDPGARVGLVVVDKAVHVLNKNRLTQTKIWDVIEKHDTGCTAGGGRDVMGVFSDAGLMFESNTAGGTDTRLNPECPDPPKRRRRRTESENLRTITATLAGQYADGQRQCCIDGMKDNKLGYTCERRATYIGDGPECVKAFLHCCDEMKKRKNIKTEEEEMILARSDDDDDYYTDSEEIVSRTQFPESWLWEEIDLCDNCPASAMEKAMYLKDSITTWQVLAVSMSPTLGICVAEPEEIVVFKSLFIDLKMPYSAVRGEQLEIKAIIHNYTPDKRKVRVEFMESADVCSLASKKGKYRTTVTIPKESSLSVPYVIIPMTLGNHMIEVKAAAYDAVYTDGVRKGLKVVSEGVLFPLQRPNVELNPVKNGDSPIIVRADIPADRVPGTPAHTHISITGEEISQTVEQAISGSFMGQLIVQPHGCGEQNMIFMTLPVIATHYLDSTNQWEAIGMKRRDEAIGHIKTGYNRQQAYRKPDGSYAAWIDRPSSTWLTAYVAKIFAMANDLITIEEQVLCSALKWLVLNRQLPDGSFEEKAAVVHGEMVGDVQGRDAEASLTAFVTIAMQEGRELCGAIVGSLPESIRKAVSFLEGKLNKLTNPYAVALTSYAMAGADKLNKAVLMKFSTKGEAGTYWNVPGQQYHTREATSYAVLALVKARDFNAAGEAVHWLGSQHYSYGGSGTTQATIMVFQAVAEYRTQVKDSQNFNLEVELAVEGRSKPSRYTIKRDNRHVSRSDKVDINKDFNVTAKGTGKATLSVLTLYYARPVEKKSDCTLFDLSVKIDKDPETKHADAIETFKLTMDFFYKNPKSPATMTILDIGIPTGFTVEYNDLEELTRGKEKYLEKFEMDKALSDRGSLILYLKMVSNKESERIAFRMHKMLNVGLLQPAAVTIYEYYSPNARCTKYFHPEREGVIYRLCKGDMCQCAEENCSLQKKGGFKDEERNIKACESGMDYVYKVKVKDMELAADADIYQMEVEQVLKEGTDQVIEGQVKSFLGRPSCKESLGFVQGKSYLIMGKSTDLPKLGGSLQYILGEQTWIEYWPTSQESKSAEHRDRYIGITELENMLTKEGCAT
ncbi:complement C3a.1 precursor [Danio rerio]|uniref:Complement C3a.1 precursor n=1 Tax=Danio rerio TaxID=7955 RepID=A0A8M1P7C1_DANRE|nr:complement C3a.1 precursor [Danio rerio]|eukprot:NP_571317.1 complement component c3a precursor [Danio rerio]